MLVSVFDWKTMNYDYYEVPGDQDHGGWFELQGLGINRGGATSGVGIDIEDALPSLPMDAKYLSTGKNAKGRIFIKRDSAERGKSEGMSGVPSERLVNLHTLPPNDRIKFYQDKNRHLLDFTGPHYISQGLSGNTALGDPNTTEKPKPRIPDEIPLAMFLVPLLTGAGAGYFAAARTDSAGKRLATFLGFVGGVTAGIAVGREYEGYKQATLRR